jgi:hypothetical protein
MSDDTHYTPENTENGVHACDDPACMTAGLKTDDLAYLAYSLAKMGPVIADSPVKTTLFRDETGVYVLLTVDYGDSKAVIGALYTPTLMADLRSKGYTTSWAEAAGGVN